MARPDIPAGLDGRKWMPPNGLASWCGPKERARASEEIHRQPHQAIGATSA
jgi:hypothetical protein